MKSTRCYLYFSIAIIFVSLLTQFISIPIFSVPNEQIIDKIGDWNIIKNQSTTYDPKYIISNSYACKITDYSFSSTDFPLPDLTGVSYSSFNDILNVTLWLSDSFKDPIVNRSLSTVVKGGLITLWIINDNSTLESDVNQTYQYLKNSRFFSNINILNDSSIEYEYVNSKTKEMFFEKDDKKFVIVYTINKNLYEDNLDVIDSILNSFHLIDKKNNDNTITKVDDKLLNFSYPNTWNISSFSFIDPDFYKDKNLTDLILNNRTLLVTLEKSERQILSYLTRDYFVNLNVISDTENEGYVPDYRIGLKWENSTKYWKQYFIESDPSGFGFEKDIITPMILKDIKSDKKYIQFTIDLKKILLPIRYSLIFGVEDEYILGNKYCYIGDYTDFFYIPSPKYNITLTEKPLVLNPGEKKDIRLKIDTNAPFFSNVSLSRNKIENINTTITPDMFTISPKNFATSNINIVVDKDSPKDIETLLIKVKVYNRDQPEVLGYKTIEGILPYIIYNKTIDIPIVIDPIKFEDTIANLLNPYGDIISKISLIVTTVGALVSGAIVIVKKLFKKKYQKKISQY